MFAIELLMGQEVPALLQLLRGSNVRGKACTEAANPETKKKT